MPVDNMPYFQNDGNGNMIEQPDVFSTAGVASVVTGDFNMDGHTDIAVSRVSGLTWYRNEDGTGTNFSEQLVAVTTVVSHMVRPRQCRNTAVLTRLLRLSWSAI